MKRPRFTFDHLPPLDGLRGLAVAGVLLFHGGHLTGGYLGVDLFFVLSGFLITSLLLRERSRDGSIDLLHFWGRRARRLLPAVFGLLIGVGLFSIFVALPAERPGIRGDTIATVFYYANWRQVFNGVSYWDLFATPSPLQHTWSLSIEEQFYLLWPLVVLGVMMAARDARAMLSVALGGAAVSAVLMIVIYDHTGDANRVYFGTDTRAQSILIGAALASALVAYGHPGRGRGRRVVEGVGMVAAVFLGWAWVTVDGLSPSLYQGLFTLCALAVAAVILAISTPGGSILGGVVSLRPLQWLGLISYGLYLWHWPIFVWLETEEVASGWALFAIQVAVSIGVAYLSYRLIEQPIRRQGLSAWPNARVLMPTAAVACFAFAMIATADTSRETASLALGDQGELVFPPSDVAIPRPAGREARMVLVGDSVADYLGQVLEASTEQTGVVVDNQAVVGCTISRSYGGWRVDGRENPEPEICRTWPTMWEDALQADDPDAVVVLFGRPYLGELLIGDTYVDPCDPVFLDHYRQEFEAAFQLLSSTGATVYFSIAPVPRGLYVDDQLEASIGCVNGLYEELADRHPEARLLRLDQLACPDGECPKEVAGVNLRPDGTHFEGEGAAVASAWLVSQVFGPVPDPASGPGATAGGQAGPGGVPVPSVAPTAP